jgi:hypothetical protein
MPKSKTARKIMNKMKDKYGEKEGEKVYYATAKKQNRDEKTYKKESLKLVSDLIAETVDGMVILPAGTILEMVSTGAIAAVPNSLEIEEDEEEDEEIDEASNSQITQTKMEKI